MIESERVRSERGLGGELVTPVAATVLAVLPSFLVGALAVQIRADLGFSVVRLGGLLTIFALTGVVASPLAGRLVDRVGARHGLLLSASVVSLGMLVAAVARSWDQLAVAFFIAGLGNSVAHPSANLTLARRIPSVRQGLAFGIKQAAIPTAIFLAGLAVPLVGLTVGWRWAFAAGSVGAGLLVVLTPRMEQEGPIERHNRAQRKIDLGPLLLVAAAAFLAIAGVQAVVTFLVESAVDRGIGAGMAGLILSAASVVGIVVRVSSGWVADRIRGRSVLLVVAAYMAVGAIGLIVIASSVSLAAFTVGAVIGLGAGWSWNGLMHFAVVRAYPEGPATATSVLQAGLLSGAASGPLVFGLIVTSDSYRSAWLLAAGSLLAASLVAVITWRAMLERQIEADGRRSLSPEMT